ncbi:hypothetical protein DLM78_18530 [Leptospira stimsonii]|uniref:Apea-like HEPN domain-containing protein n=1 Tax=Leptospira stimsonii TaxID=2202203 RepID=A0A8B3CKQ5_9LEPT|nr:hypothetical protein DLM78_18530 [Leptospira stimsonii]
MDSTWEKWLGEINSDKMKDSNLFIFIFRDAKGPDEIGDENWSLSDQILRIYSSLLINDIFFNEPTHRPRPFVLTGEYGKDSVTLQMISEINKPISLVSPKNAIKRESIRTVYEISNSLSALYENIDSFSRIAGGIRAFEKGIASYHFEDRFHSFVRTLEAFIYLMPREGKNEFAKRVSELTKFSDKTRLQKVYALRSSIEHMHHPFRGFEGFTKSEFQKHTFELEVLARGVLKYFLLTPKVWDYFSDLNLENTWKGSERHLAREWD